MRVELELVHLPWSQYMFPEVVVLGFAVDREALSAAYVVKDLDMPPRERAVVGRDWCYDPREDNRYQGYEFEGFVALHDFLEPWWCVSFHAVLLIRWDIFPDFHNVV